MNERDEKLIQNIGTVVQPNCPTCKDSPLGFLCNVVRTGAGHLVAIIWCGHCGHTLSTQFLGVDQPIIQPALVRPS